MKYAIKTLNPDKENVRWEIHKTDCKDNHRNDPMDVYIPKKEFESPEQVIQWDLNTQDPFSSWSGKNYKIMNCTK